MHPPVFETLKAASAVTALFGSAPLRVYEFGEAPAGVTLPYCVWQLITGLPENYLGNVPDIDSFTVQVDVYGSTPGQSRAAAQAVCDALEPVAYVVGYRGEGRDPDTRHHRYSFDIDFLTNR